MPRSTEKGNPPQWSNIVQKTHEILKMGRHGDLGDVIAGMLMIVLPVWVGGWVRGHEYVGCMFLRVCWVCFHECVGCVFTSVLGY